MQAAARLFAAKGYNAVSVRDIAAEMDLTPASLYYYFPDKETLYRQTLVMVFTGVQSYPNRRHSEYENRYLPSYHREKHSFPTQLDE